MAAGSEVEICANVLEAIGRPSTQPIKIESLGGGCIHRAVKVSCAAEDPIVIKINRNSQLPMFEAEAAGLRALHATQTVKTPQVLFVGEVGDAACLALECLQSARADDEAWTRFGRALANLHHAPAGERYGFDADNYIGKTPQINTWSDDWVEFNRQYRLGAMLRRLVDSGMIQPDEQASVQRVMDRLDQLIPRHPKPALLHGDLWSGNALPTNDDSGQPAIAIIDPAVYIGDGWADIAMMRLFGGFPTACFAAYEAEAGSHERIDTRIAVYQLYHVLNHAVLFGRGYISQAMSLCARCGS